MSLALLRGVSRGFPRTGCARCCNLTWRVPGCSSAPATLACACNLPGFCKRRQPTVGELQGRHSARVIQPGSLRPS